MIFKKPHLIGHSQTPLRTPFAPYKKRTTFIFDKGVDFVKNKHAKMLISKNTSNEHPMISNRALRGEHSS